MEQSYSFIDQEKIERHKSRTNPENWEELIKRIKKYNSIIQILNQKQISLDPNLKILINLTQEQLLQIAKLLETTRNEIEELWFKK